MKFLIAALLVLLFIAAVSAEFTLESNLNSEDVALVRTLAVSTGKHYKSTFRQLRRRHKGLKKVDTIIRKVINDLTKNQHKLHRQIRNSLNKRNRAHSKRYHQTRHVKNLKKQRFYFEAKYNAKRKQELKAYQKLKVYEAVHRRAIRAYRHTYKRNSKLIKEFDHEKRVLTEIRRVLGGNRSAGFRHHRDQRIARKASKHGFKSYRDQRSRFHHGKQAFTGHKKINRKNKIGSTKGQCYVAHHVGRTLDHRGWSRCKNGYVMTSLYRGKCSSLHCIEAFRCCRTNKKINRVIHKYIRKGPRTPGWQMCPTGYVMNGVHRTGDYRHRSQRGLNMLTHLRCIKNTGAPFKRCYHKNVGTSFDRAGWNGCRKGYALAGMWKNKCNSIYCYEHFRCCK